MTGHACVAEVEPRDELADGKLLAPDLAEDLLTARLGNELQRVHLVIFPVGEMSVTLASLK